MYSTGTYPPFNPSTAMSAMLLLCHNVFSPSEAENISLMLYLVVVDSFLHFPICCLLSAAQCRFPAIMFLKEACCPFGSLDECIPSVRSNVCVFLFVFSYGTMTFTLCISTHLCKWKPFIFFPFSIHTGSALTFWLPETLSALNVTFLRH